jgi:transposase
MGRYHVERLDHLGIVAGICEEIGLVAYFDALDDHEHARVSLGQAVLAMILNGLGFSNRRLYLVPQFFANKPVERLIGPGIMAEDLNDDCLGRTLDWLTAHDLTALFAGLAYQARQRFGVPARVVHVDSTSFAVEGAYAAGEDEPDEDAQVIRITYGYSRDHRADLQQWGLSLATTTGGVPIGLQLLAGNAQDKAALAQQVQEVLFQSRAAQEEAAIYVADSGLYQAATMTKLEQQQVRWLSRVPETSVVAKSVIADERVVWEGTDQLRWWEQSVSVGARTERWIIVQSAAGRTHHLATMQQRAEQDRQAWTQRLHTLQQRTFACEEDAQTALTALLPLVPPWLQLTASVERTDHFAHQGRPRKDAVPHRQDWSVVGTVEQDGVAVAAEAWRKAKFILATNVPATERPAEVIIRLYTDQSGVERGFAFRKDPLFLASSVFVKKTARVMATGFLMVLCLLVYRLAEYRLRARLAEHDEMIPNQVKKPIKNPTMRWIFQCFDGIDLHHTHLPDGTWQVEVLRLEDLHRHVLRLLGNLYEKIYCLTN